MSDLAVESPPDGEHVAIQYSGKLYSAFKCADGRIHLRANPGAKIHFGDVTVEAAAIQWLCDRSLRKSKARQLMAAVLRNEGPFADKTHPRRIRGAELELATASPSFGGQEVHGTH